MSMGAWNDQALALIRKAVLAPSSHNTQPWLFRISESAIDLHADRTRALPVNDPEDRELTISCGCALLNLRLAAASCGLGVQLQLLPAREEPDWLARASFTRDTGPHDAEAELSGFIEHRRTYRKRFAPAEVDAAIVDQLLPAASAEGAWLRPLSGEVVRQQAAAMVARGDAAQWADPGWRHELAAWMRPRRRGDGLTVPSLAAPVVRFMVRTFDMGGIVGGKDRDLAAGAPLLAVLGTERDGPDEWLRAGQALQRVLLTACKIGLHASYLNQPVQVAKLRPELQDIAGGGVPQIVVRLGYPSRELAAAPRRPVDAVVADTV